MPSTCARYRRIYFYFQNHDRVYECDRTVARFTEVMFYFAFVGMCLFVCIICCVMPLMVFGIVSAAAAGGAE